MYIIIWRRYIIRIICIHINIIIIIYIYVYLPATADRRCAPCLMIFGIICNRRRGERVNQVFDKYPAADSFPVGRYGYIMCIIWRVIYTRISPFNYMFTHIYIPCLPHKYVTLVIPNWFPNGWMLVCINSRIVGFPI